MNQMKLGLNPEDIISTELFRNGIEGYQLERKDYPDETIFVLKVAEVDFRRAAELGNALDHLLQSQGFKALVTVRKSSPPLTASPIWLKDGVGNQRAAQFASLLTARSRTSEVQPSLDYIPDTAQSITAVVASRHHLIFGRRGAGKTALMVEAKRLVVEQGQLAVWVNLQSLRSESAARAFVIMCQRICDSMQSYFAKTQRIAHVASMIVSLRSDLEQMMRGREISDTEFGRLVPRVQGILRRFLETVSLRLYIFIDELHYFDRVQQPRLLDAFHGMVRDCDAWLKIAGIRHLSRWFQSHPPLGLQTGHDADHIDLDITLESPSKAKSFLEQILASYARSAGISSLGSLLIGDALDRLVLASGAVPRDYLVLCADAVRQAQRRERAKLVGVQDVNKAAGEAAKVKLAELEDDASSGSSSPKLVNALNCIREFCLDQKRFTCFRIDLRDKEEHPIEYGLVQDLLDLRLLHLIESSLSDENEAGRRSEVYMIDLSQFSGQRLKKNLKALDFKEGHLVLKETGTATPARSGATSKQRLGILRRAPLFQLELLTKRPG